MKMHTNTPGADVTRPVQLTPTDPTTKRGEWWVPKADGYMHHISASHMVATGELWVHIGCSTLITDTVRDGETHWEAIRRVVTTWQAEQREADHAEALAMVAEMEQETAAPVETAEHTPTLPRDGWGRWTVTRGPQHYDAMTGYGFAWAYATAAWVNGAEWVKAAGWLAGVEFTPLDPSADRPTALGATQRDEWPA
jgi:hypothetical protein